MHRLGVVVLAGALLAGCAGGAGGGRHRAVIECLAYVQEHLQAQSTAIFPHVGDDAVQVDGAHYTVSSYVEHQGPQGGMIRSDWSCTMQQSGENWRLTALTIHGVAIPTG